MQFRQAAGSYPSPAPAGLRFPPFASRHCARGLLLLFALCSLASAQSDTLAPAGPVTVFATFHAAGIRVPVVGDTNSNGQVRLEFRSAGEARWRQALPLARIEPHRFAGSIFGLIPDTEYEARVILEDPDRPVPQTRIVQFATATEKYPAGTGRTWYVRAGSSGDGTEAAPFGAIQQAVDRAGPGDVILVLAGVYRESVLIRQRSGRAEAYILLRGRSGAQIAGTIEELERTGGDRWRGEGDGVFSTAVADEMGDIGYVAAGEARLYRYGNREELRQRAAAVNGGWHWKPLDPRLLYVALPDGRDPDEVPMRVSNRPYGLRLENSSYWIIDGLDIGFFGSSERRGRNYGIVVEGSSNIVVRNNRIHHCNHGVATIGASTTRILIEGNEIYDTSIIRWPWNRVKATEAEGSAVSLKGGPGQVVRRNRIRGYFNGVAASTWGALQDETRNNDLDIYENEFYEIGDDPLEPEGTCINMRIWGNTIRNCLTAVSLAPITVGPTYVLRNVSLDHWGTAVKLGSGENNFGVKYVLHNTFVTTLRERRQLDGSVVPEGVNAATLWPHQPLVPRENRPLPTPFWANGILLNNIFYGTRYAIEAARLQGEATLDYNNLYTSGYPEVVKLRDTVYRDLGSFRLAGYERHGISARSRFRDIGRGDLRLQAESPEVDRAKRLPNINDEFAGSAPDIGAFEFATHSK